MKIKFIFLSLILFAVINSVFSQKNSHSLQINLTVPEDVQNYFKSEGRLFIFLNTNPRAEPRTQVWPNRGNSIFAKNFADYKVKQLLKIDSGTDWNKTPDWGFDDVPQGEYNLQILWDQDSEESRINAPGNIFSEKQIIKLNENKVLDVSLSKIVEPRKTKETDLLKYVNFKSESLSKWWSKDVYLKASVLLPSGYNDSNKYAIRYNVAGYGGRYTRVRRLTQNEKFMQWWQSDDSPQIINVFLDGEGPFGDSYQMDSENSGPYGYALISELIPHIESIYRGTDTPKTRFVDGCSTGGWVSLGLQLYYPDHFNGVFSYSPDAIEFENYQLINIYKDKNAYVNEHGFLRPVMRDVNGEPMMSLKEFINYENVLGASDSYLDSGGQFSAHNALYSPKGDNGLPKPLFDPNSGKIDHDVAEHWKKYDFKIYAKENWEELGPKIQDKVFIWMGDMDHFYLNPATRAFDDFLKTTNNPVSNAEVVFTAMQGHCSFYDPKQVLVQMQERLEKIQASGVKAEKH